MVLTVAAKDVRSLREAMVLVRSLPDGRVTNGSPDARRGINLVPEEVDEARRGEVLRRCAIARSR
ncbi:MAG TPA: hypothetical protein VFT55_09365 [Planctomycetota bacterium]|nr:hypothetical protein [Planctomycetota bacterium]